MKIQNQYRKIIWLLCLSFLGAVFPYGASAQTTSTGILKKADSLYADKQYTEAIKHYEELYREAEVASAAMLLRMAFIQEGLGEYSQALYYLNEYYALTSDGTVVNKISDLSEAHQLRGYEFSDSDYIQVYIKKYQYIFVCVLIVLCLGGLIYYKVSRKNQDRKPYGLGIGYLLVVGLLFYLVNFSVVPDYGIIVDSNTYIMTAPSAGSDVVNITNKGHKVKVSGNEDVWARIEWNGEPAYIRQDNLRLLKH